MTGLIRNGVTAHGGLMIMMRARLEVSSRPCSPSRCSRAVAAAGCFRAGSSQACTGLILAGRWRATSGSDDNGGAYASRNGS